MPRASRTGVTMNDAAIALAEILGLGPLEPSARDVLQSSAVRGTLPPNTVLLRPGDACEHFFLVARGSVRVQRLSETGREIVLYRIGPGESCILTTAALLAAERYSAEAVAETVVETIGFPASTFDILVSTSRSFRAAVFATYAARLAELMLLVEEVAFKRVDVRLARCLLRLQDGSATVPLTHRELAIELGTAREVVSRQLKEFERRGWVRLRTGAVVVENDPAMAGFVTRHEGD